MTEEELTQIAILKAKGEKIREKHTLEREDPKPNKEPKVYTETEKPKVDAKEEPKEEPKEEQPEQSEYPETISFSSTKKISYKLWTGKTKKLFTSMLRDLEDPEDLDITEALDILLYDNLEGDPYLTEVEQQAVLLAMREKSISPDFEILGVCEECKHEENFTAPIKEIYKFTENKFPEKIDGIKYVDIKTRSELTREFRRIETDPYYDGITNETDVEIALHLDLGKSVSETLDWMDEQPILKVKEIMNNLSELSPQISQYVERECPECKAQRKFWTDSLPDIFEEIVM